MRLYYSPGACSLSPDIVLRETRLPFDLVKVDLTTHRTASGADYYGINPIGCVPVLEFDNGKRLTEGPLIAQFIAAKAGREDLLPKAGTMASYRVKEWQNHITSELHKSFSPLFNPAYDLAAKAIQSATLRKQIEWLATELERRPYIGGEGFTVADAYLFTVINWSGHVNLDLSDLKPLQEFLKKVAARTAVKTSMRAEGLIPS